MKKCFRHHWNGSHSGNGKVEQKKVSCVSIGSYDLCLDGRVADKPCNILLDTGADISVVPDDLIDTKYLIDEKVRLVGFNAEPYIARCAQVKIEVEDLVMDSKVAVAPGYMSNNCVLLAVDSNPNTLINELRKSKDVIVKNKQVMPVTTRAAKKQNKKEYLKSGENQSSQVKPTPMNISEQSNQETEIISDNVAEVEQRVKNTGCANNDSEKLIVEMDEVVRDDGRQSEKDIVEGSGGEALVDTSEQCMESSEDVEVSGKHAQDRRLRIGEEVELEVIDRKCDVQIVVDVPNVRNNTDVQLLIDETLNDDSLSTCRKLADAGQRGFFWRDGILFHRQAVQDLGWRDRMVAPAPRRKQILEVAHDRCGHPGARRLKEALEVRFHWPKMFEDCLAYCKSCKSCAEFNKSGKVQTPMIIRSPVNQPFEHIALDIIGPLPKGKGGCRYVLTTACMATRWVDGVPLRRATAKEVADGCLTLFSRMGIPLKILSDNGTQFVSSLLKDVCSLLGIAQIQVSPYRPAKQTIKVWIGLDFCHLQCSLSVN